MFSLNSKCELTNGKYGSKPGELTRSWPVTAKMDPPEQTPEAVKCAEYCVEWKCGPTGSGCVRLGNSCDSEVRPKDICGKGCRTQC